MDGNLTESQKMENAPPTEPGWYWVLTNPAWGGKPEAVFIGVPEYDYVLHVYDISGDVIPINIYCNKYPRKWLGKLQYPS